MIDAFPFILRLQALSVSPFSFQGNIVQDWDFSENRKWHRYRYSEGSVYRYTTSLSRCSRRNSSKFDKEFASGKHRTIFHFS